MFEFSTPHNNQKFMLCDFFLIVETSQVIGMWSFKERFTIWTQQILTEKFLLKKESKDIVMEGLWYCSIIPTAFVKNIENIIRIFFVHSNFSLSLSCFWIWGSILENRWRSFKISHWTLFETDWILSRYFSSSYSFLPFSNSFILHSYLKLDSDIISYSHLSKDIISWVIQKRLLLCLQMTVQPLLWVLLYVSETFSFLLGEWLEFVMNYSSSSHFWLSFVHLCYMNLIQIHAMIETDSCAIVRYVKRKNAAPQLGVLTPSHFHSSSLA